MRQAHALPPPSLSQARSVIFYWTGLPLYRELSVESDVLPDTRGDATLVASR
jgi:hypothetical protein